METLELPARLKRTIAALGISCPVTWTVQETGKRVHLNLEFIVEEHNTTTPSSGRGSTFCERNPSHTGPHPKKPGPGPEKEKKKSKKKKSPSTRRRDARRLETFLKKNEEKAEEKTEETTTISSPATPVTPIHSPATSPLRGNLEDDDVTSELETGSETGSLMSPSPISSPSLDQEQAQILFEQIRSLREDNRATIEETKDHNKTMTALIEQRNSHSTNIPEAARTRPFHSIINSPSTPTTATVSPSQPPPPKKKKKRHR